MIQSHAIDTYSIVQPTDQPITYRKKICSRKVTNIEASKIAAIFSDTFLTFAANLIIKHSKFERAEAAPLDCLFYSIDFFDQTGGPVFRILRCYVFF